MHLLAYHFDAADEDFVRMLKHHQKMRIDRAARIINRLRKKGIHIELDEVVAEAMAARSAAPILQP